VGKIEFHHFSLSLKKSTIILPGKNSTDAHACLSVFFDCLNYYTREFKFTTSLYTGEEFESISKFLIGNWFHVTLRVVSISTTTRKQRIRAKRWKAIAWADTAECHDRERSAIRHTGDSPQTSVLILMHGIVLPAAVKVVGCRSKGGNEQKHRCCRQG